MKDFKVSFDNLLVYKYGYTMEDVYDVITNERLSGLRIFSDLKSDGLDDISFLKNYTFLEALDVTGVNDYDFNFLSSLTNLKKLSINVKGQKKIDLSNLTKLEFLTLQWRENITGLNFCTNLLSLGLVEFKEKDLQKIDSLQSLVELRIKTGSIISLKGANKLTNLNIINIGNCTKLESVADINHLTKLKELYLERCPKIKDFDTLTELAHLQKLSIIDCGKVQSLKFIEKYPSLENLSLLGNTLIVDGDLIPAQRIKYLAHKHHKHYNVKLENSLYNQNVDKNLAKIKNLFK